MTYSIKTGLWKSLIKTSILAIPAILAVIIDILPKNLKELTIGAVLVYATNFISNWAKNK